MIPRKIYVASSWRNTFYPEVVARLREAGHDVYDFRVVARLREAGHDVYDFRNPPSGDPGFKWSSKEPMFV